MATPPEAPEPLPVVPACTGCDVCAAGSALAAAGGVWLFGTGEAAADAVGRESGGDTEGTEGVGNGIGGSAMNAAATMPIDQLLAVISKLPRGPRATAPGSYSLSTNPPADSCFSSRHTF